MSDKVAPAQTHQFKAEVAAVLRLVTNSLYTNREIFLRELVSNASDALDKARFAAVVDAATTDQDATPRILITIDPARGVLVIEDTGIGMTHDEAAENLGTIAHSGTLKFLREAAAKGKEGERPDLDLIGQFGVGFYSAFMVSDRIDVFTKSATPGSTAVHWQSTGDGGFTLTESDRSVRGTRIELHIKEDAKEFLEAPRIENIVRRYSNFVLHPIELQVLEGGDASASKPHQINAANAFWALNATEISDEQYQEFYTHVMGGFVLPGDEPLARLHLSMDAPLQFRALLYVPGRRPHDLFAEDTRSLALYARRVLIMENCDKLLPTYLRFVRGVVDSEDLPLNVSRESLQEHQSLAAIRRQLTRKVLRLLADTASEDAARYDKLWGEFGVFLKEGLHTDNGHRKELTELLRFSCTDHEGLISLSDYVAGMKDDQPAIYYVTGESAEALARSPHLEACHAKGYRVLLMTDAVDEWVLQDLREYDGKPLRSVSQGDLGLDGEESDAATDDAGIGDLLAKAKEILGGRVRDVRASKRLTDSAACLVDSADGISNNMERILRAANRKIATAPRILELNPKHPFVLAAQAKAAEGGGDPLPMWVELLADQAHLAEGDVPDPAAMVKRLQWALDRAAGLDGAAS
jgi:molecular chaperone HtpG